MLDKITAWAQKEDTIRALILIGSQAGGNKKADFLSDFDITLFVTDATAYTQSDAWLSSLGEVWVCVHEVMHRGGKDWPVRLVIFAGGVKVDFVFFDVHVLKSVSPQAYLMGRYVVGHEVLLDKDGAAVQLQVAKLQAPACQKPSVQEFERVVNEFFFEAYHVAKYLHRDDLWHAKFRDWATKEFLLCMIEWHAVARHGLDFNTYELGLHMHEWADQETVHELGTCFGHFDASDSWRALQATMNLFRRLAQQTAGQFGYQYSTSVDKNISGFIERLMAH